MCGLFGIINQEPKKFDKRAFITLGCANDDRGGDACGVFIDGFVEYGTEKDDVWFQSWYRKSEQLGLHKKVKVALGHCRKASVGGKTADKAQPVVIRNEKGDIVFCMIHNGTIHNYEELAKKYVPDVDIKGMSDSQVMAQIFYNGGYQALGEYRGGGAFVIADYRDNTVKMFKGASLAAAYKQKVEEERPLYYAEIGDDGIVFSSIYSILQGLYYDKDIYTVPANTLVVVDHGRLYELAKYDRSKCCQSKAYTTTAVSTTTTHGNSCNNYYRESGYWDDWDYCGGYETYGTKPNILFNITDGLYHKKGINDSLVNGCKCLNKYGYICSSSPKLYPYYYFWRGILLQGKNAYEVLDEYWKLPGTTADMAIGLARIFSYNPVYKGGRFITYDPVTLGEVVCDDFYDFPFTMMLVEMRNGQVHANDITSFPNEVEIEGNCKEYYEAIKRKYVASLQRK